MGDLKYRERLSSSVDKGLYRAIRKYSIETRIPLSKLLDEAIEDFLRKSAEPVLSLVPRYKGSRIARQVETSNAESPTPV